MSVSFSVLVKRKIQIAQVSLDQRKVAMITNLLKVKTRGCVFDQGPVDVRLAVLWRCQPSQKKTVFEVKASLESMILTLLDQGESLVIKIQCHFKSLAIYFDDRGTD